ncbi:hypothetical protein ABKN59_002888 [Abortiporus biennis]
MSSSSTTACSRSPSPTSPATPASSDTLEPVVTQEDLAAWCQSLSPAGFLINDPSHFAHAFKSEPSSIDFDDIIHDDKLADSTHSDPDVPSALLLSRSPSVPFSMGMDITTLHARPRHSFVSVKPLLQAEPSDRRDPQTDQCVVYPPKESCYNLPIMIPSIPPGGTKSRVETQVRLIVDLAHASASSGEPLKYDRVGSWKWLRLPRGTSTKRRSRKEAKVDAAPEDTLHLTTEITCASPPNTRVSCCTSCQGREAKRVARKLAARVRPAKSEPDGQDEVVVIPGRGPHEDNSNLVQFNCPEVLDFSSGSVILPLRITCYCRHHREKVGFLVHFTMLDNTGRVVGSGITPPIMITDDHKSTGANKNNARSNSPSLEHTVEDVSETVSSNKRKGARSDTGSRKRTKPYDINGRTNKTRRADSDSAGSTPSTLTSAIPSALNSAVVTRATSPAQPIVQTSPMISTSPNIHAPDPVQAANDVAATLLSTTFDLPMSTPTSSVVGPAFNDVVMPDPHNQMNIDGSGISLDDLANSSFLQPDPTSSSIDPAQSLNVSAPPMSFMLFNHDLSPSVTSLPPPKIHRLIPSSGPTYGGIEVTVLGANFHPAMQLNCVFGDARSTATHRWSDNTLVCVLPPSATPGVVSVWFDGIVKDEDGTPPSLFTYTDETDRALMELALQVVGLKMTGKIEDARNVAMRIVGTTGPDESHHGMAPGVPMQMAAAAPQSVQDIRRLLLTNTTETSDFEQLILDFLAVLDVPTESATFSLSTAISHTSQSGQTLLHLATYLNFSRVVSFLLSHDIDIDARDRNGYTALHVACLKKSTECARSLLNAGAATDVVNASGLTATEIAPGFLDSLNSVNLSEIWDDTLEEEGAWADVEEESSEEDVAPRPYFKRRIPRRRKGKHAHRSSSIADSRVETPQASASDSKGSEAGVVDEKQAMASLIDMVQRTFAQLQHPQGMIPNLPLPQLPHLRGMPAWGALPQMPAVFPVYVPMTALPAFPNLWGEKRPDHPEGEGDTAEKVGNKNPQWLGIPTAQDWKSMWEKWMTMSAANARQPEEAADAPPAYTPRESSEDLLTEKAGEPSTSIISAPSTPVPHATVATERPASRRVGYEDAADIPEQELNSYAYRPAKKQSRRAHKKHDRMLVLFWIPILFIAIIWAFLHAMRVGFHTMRAVLTANNLNLLRA